MSEVLRDGERLVCIGQTALRAPDGTPMKGVPMYIIVGENKVNANDGLTDGERSLFRDIGGIFAAKMKAYVEGGGLA